MLEFQDNRRIAVDIDVTQNAYFAALEKISEVSVERGLRYFRPRDYMDITEVAAFMHDNLIRHIDGKIPA